MLNDNRISYRNFITSVRFGHKHFVFSCNVVKANTIRNFNKTCLLLFLTCFVFSYFTFVVSLKSFLFKKCLLFLSVFNFIFYLILYNVLFCLLNFSVTVSFTYDKIFSFIILLAHFFAFTKMFLVYNIHSKNFCFLCFTIDLNIDKMFEFFCTRFLVFFYYC